MTLPTPGWRLGLLLALLSLSPSVPGAPGVDAATAPSRPGPAGAPRGSSAAGAAAAERLKAEGPVLRVLLRQDTSLDLAAVSAPLRLADERGRPLLEVSPGERLRLRLTGGAVQAEVAAATGNGRQLALPPGPVWVDPVVKTPGGEALFALQDNAFRGRLLVRSEGDRLQAINLVGVESYLPSVVGSEMPASWPQAALRAQAIAARTYALSQRRPASVFDLKATVASQMYRGVAAETPSTREAVASTRAQVLTFGDGLINAVFHSSSGGSTENSGEIWKRQLPYLVSVPDFDDRSPVREWQVRFDAEQLRRSFPETGGVSTIDVLSTSPTGRVRQVRVSGPGGVQVFSGIELRQRLGLRSTLVRLRLEPPDPTALLPLPGAAPPPQLPSLPEAAADGLPDDLNADPATGAPVSPGFPSAWRQPVMAPPGPSLVVDGRGFGHGVGMSQWGAYALAQRGRSYEQILRHYYRGARIEAYVSR